MVNMTTRSTDIVQCDLRDACPSGGRHASGSNSFARHNALARGETFTKGDDLVSGYSDLDETVLGEGQMVNITDAASALSIIDGFDPSTIIYGAQTSEVVLMRPSSLEGDAMAVVVFWDPKPPPEAEVCRSIGAFDSKPAPGDNGAHTWSLTGPGYEASLAAVREGMHRLGADESMTASADVASSAAAPGVLLEFTVRVPKRYAELPVGEIVDGVLSPWIDVFDHLTRDVHRAGTVAPLYRELGSRVLDRKMHF